ncbi:hypothetical protein SAMD00019534_020090, partial [Acytostelium subglobosum LB1]|uniref:hypothetical protein n=1 Tax=Acytostelium subglobosum LB1 TaxID=1410327 RepID=UPI000644D47A
KKISSNVNHVMCIEDFRNGILVQSTLCPGFGTMVCNLFTSRQPESNEEEKWIAEYVSGSVNSIYKIPVPISMVGETLGFVTTTMYSGAKALVLGIIDEGDDGDQAPNPHASSSSLPTAAAHHDSHGKSRFTIHPPFSTILKSSMHLVIIAHSPTAPVFKPNIPSIIRKMEQEDKGSSHFSTLFNRLFAPDEVGRSQELQDETFLHEGRHFFTSTYSPTQVEMEDLPNTSSPSASPRPTVFNQPSQDLLASVDPSEIEALEEPRPNPLLELCRTEFDNNWEDFLCNVIESVDSKKSHLEEIVEELEPIIRSIEKHQNLDNDDLYDKEELPQDNWKEHIIICGSVNRIDLFLRGLRQKHIAENLNRFHYIKNQKEDRELLPPTIVILHPEEPDMSEWDDIEDIHYIKGSPLERKDLEMCRVHLASKIIILSDPYSNKNASSVTSETSVQLDSATIMAYLEVNEMLVNSTNNSLVTVELVHEPNIRFISTKSTKSQMSQNTRRKINRDDEELEKPKYYITSDFASGKVMTLTTLDSLLCQANHNEFLLDVASELVLGVNGIKRYHKKITSRYDDDYSDDSYEYGSRYDSYGDDHSGDESTPGAAGASNNNNNSGHNSHNHSLNNSHLNINHNHRNRSFLKTNVTPTMSKSSSLVSLHQYYQDCLLNQIKVPNQFHGRTYGELFEGLVQKNILALGLYRCKEITGAPNPYVFTCPPATTTLHENDLVYILYRQIETSN